MRSMVLSLVPALLLGACNSGGKAASRPADVSPAQAAEAPSHDPLEAAIQKEARKHAPFMNPDGGFRHAKLKQGESKDLVFVLKAPYCYTLFARGGPDVDELDLFLFDPTGTPVQQDSTDGAHPILGVSEQICPPQSGMYRVRLTMERGHGDSALRVYRAE